MFLDLIKSNGGFTLNKDLRAKQGGFACAISGHETVYNMTVYQNQTQWNTQQVKKSLHLKIAICVLVRGQTLRQTNYIQT